MPTTTKTEWQSKILLDLAFFLRGYPEEPVANWRVKRPTMTAYRAAVDLITAIEAGDVPQPRMAPDREGGIQFEWDTLEIGILPTGRFECLRVKSNGDTEEETIALSKARQLITALARPSA
jgi:hypothetical protein